MGCFLSNVVQTLADNNVNYVINDNWQFWAIETIVSM